ncbi:PaaI family thioesterase [Clostridia bacterium]|nr:PaaI family thioesterase [Clostridia bacterium]
MKGVFTQKRKEAFINYFLQDRFAGENGMLLEDIDFGWAKASMKVNASHLNAAGMVMGGALFTLCDFAFAAASNSYGCMAIGTQMDFHLLRAPKSEKLEVQAVEIKRGRTLGIYEMCLRDEEGQLCSKMTGTVMIYKDRSLFPGSIEF